MRRSKVVEKYKPYLQTFMDKLVNEEISQAQFDHYQTKIFQWMMIESDLLTPEQRVQELLLIHARELFDDAVTENTEGGK